ncbi:MAG: hypothetical protein QM499_01140 [Flavobacteriaceae bacterium]
MKTFTTISGRKIKVSANQSKRTFTIKTESGKFRTFPMNKEEFNIEKQNTGNDWQQFLKSDDYYKIN